MRLLFFFLLLASAPVWADLPTETKAPRLTRDLGQGLAYHRVLRLPADLPTQAEAASRPVVLDLRYVAATNGDATAFTAWLKFRSAPRAPIFILANTDTAPAVLTALRSPESTAHFVVIGAAAPGFAPDIAVAFDRATERRAYDALADGTAVDLLLNDSPTKIRNDEASLSRDHPPVDGGGDATTSPRSGALEAPAVAVDRVLLRAVQLHRTLLALKKL